MELEKVLPPWARRFLGSEARTDTALEKLWDGWHLLCEANLALVESEACWVWYSEVRTPPVDSSARYFCRYYLDDTALRLDASCKHLLDALRSHLGFKLAKGRGRVSLLQRTVEALRKERPAPPPLKWLDALDSNGAWRRCEDYRNRWCHGRLPAVVGLGTNRTLARLDVGPGYQGFGFGTAQRGEWEIKELRSTLRKAYDALLGVYIRALRLMSPKKSALRAVKSMFVA